MQTVGQIGTMTTGTLVDLMLAMVRDELIRECMEGKLERLSQDELLTSTDFLQEDDVGLRVR